MHLVLIRGCFSGSGLRQWLPLPQKKEEKLGADPSSLGGCLQHFRTMCGCFLYPRDVCLSTVCLHPCHPTDMHMPDPSHTRHVGGCANTPQKQRVCVCPYTRGLYGYTQPSSYDKQGICVPRYPQGTYVCHCAS